MKVSDTENRKTLFALYNPWKWSPWYENIKTVPAAPFFLHNKYWKYLHY